MHKLKTFISKEFRPEVLGGNLDPNHKTPFTLTKTNKIKTETITVNALCFGPKKDNVLINLEHVIDKSDKLLILYYEDIHLRWSYVKTPKDSYFLFKKNRFEQYKIKPDYLYIRGCYIDPASPYWLTIGDFFNFVELWDGAVLCSPKKQMPNESKLYQLNNSLKKASKNLAAISIGKSYVIKGAKNLRFLKKNKSYIVKSLSGVRSIVVDQQNYSKWNTSNINNVPVLFQERIDGNDLRVHLINKKIFVKRSNEKTNIDYRYDKNFFKLTDVTQIDKELLTFCLLVAEKENNKLLGIDFIQTKKGYFVLEANPSPGWSAYHPYNGIDNEPFITELLKVLKND